MNKPYVPKQPPVQYTPSYAELGVIAEEGCLIEVRAPDPDSPGRWPRIWLTPEAAKALMEWLPEALALAAPEREKPNYA